MLGPNSIMRGAGFFFLKAFYYTAAEKQLGPLRQRGETSEPERTKQRTTYTFKVHSFLLWGFFTYIFGFYRSKSKHPQTQINMLSWGLQVALHGNKLEKIFTEPKRVGNLTVLQGIRWQIVIPK